MNITSLHTHILDTSAAPESIISNSGLNSADTLGLNFEFHLDSYAQFITLPVVSITGPDRGPRQMYIRTYVFYESSYNYANNTSILPYHLQVCITQRIFYCNFFVGIILIA